MLSTATTFRNFSLALWLLLIGVAVLFGCVHSLVLGAWSSLGRRVHVRRSLLAKRIVVSIASWTLLIFGKVYSVTAAALRAPEL